MTYFIISNLYTYIFYSVYIGYLIRVSSSLFTIVLSSGGAAQRVSKLVSEGLIFHNHHSGRYSQVFFGHKCYPRGQWVPSDGKTRGKENFIQFFSALLETEKGLTDKRVID